MKLGELKKVDLREYWKHEEYDFSKWLAEEQNIELLSNEIGIELTNVQTEAPSGRYSVDILAEDEETKRRIIIENQLEFTNHDHLGKIITYASGYDADIILWLVQDYREEHKQAIDWLNENTNSEINFFLIRVELWQIDNSAFAPKFNIISQPNDWAKALKDSRNKGKLSETQMMQLDYWSKFKTYAEENKSKLKLRKAQPQQWYDITYGSPISHLSLTLKTQQKLMGCEIYIPDSKEMYQELLKHKNEIEKQIGHQMEWMELPNKKASRVKLSTPADLEKEDKWQEYFEWMKTTAELFQKVFGKYKIKDVNTES